MSALLRNGAWLLAALTGLLVAMSAVSAIETNAIADVCPARDVDVVFSLGITRRMRPAHLAALKRALKVWIDAMPVGRVQYAAVTYSKDAAIAFDFNDHSTKAELFNMIDAIQVTSTSTRLTTDSAIKLVTNLFTKASKGSRPGAAKVLVTVVNERTTGRLTPLVRAMRNAPADMEAHLVIADNAFVPEQGTLTRDKIDHVYRGSDYCALQSLLEVPRSLYCLCSPTCVRGVCQANGTCACPGDFVGEDCGSICRARDLVAVLDSSDSISNKDYELLKGFVASLFGDPLFLIGKGMYHSGMIAYGYGIEVVYNLKPVKEKTEAVQIIQDLTRLEQFKGTRTSKALQRALVMFNGKGRPLNTALHTMFVITDGKATDDKNGALDNVLAEIRNASIEVFCITVNVDEDNREEIERIADRPANILRLAGFEDLAEFASFAAKGFCTEPQEPVCLPQCVHGTCQRGSTCACEDGWTGTDCSCPECCCNGLKICTEEMNCVCPDHYTANGDDCVCQDPFVETEDVTCVCPPPTVFVEEASDCCPVGYIVSAGMCSCPPRTTAVDGECECSETFIEVEGECVCPETFVEVEGQCVCRETYTEVEGVCVCPATFIEVEGKCVCRDTFIEVEGVCVCPETYTEVEGVCVCPTTFIEVEGMCICPIPLIEVDGKCERQHIVIPRPCNNTGFIGDNCDTPLCIHGTYNMVNGTCDCCNGWQSPRCDEPQCKNCDNGPCPDGTKCKCPNGWTGDICNETVCRKRDIVFVLDSSFSLNKTDFVLEKEFVADFIRDLRHSIGPCLMRFAVVKYGLDVETEFDFSHEQKSTPLIRSVRQMKRPTRFRGTKTSSALRVALQLLRAQGRDQPEVDWTLVLVSDGKSTDDKNGALMKIIDRMDTAEALRYSIGIGLDIDLDELESITGGRARTLAVENFAELRVQALRATRNICENP